MIEVYRQFGNDLARINDDPFWVPKHGGPRHVALVTGLKHYIDPFEAYGKGALPQTPFREEQRRIDIENFYYAGRMRCLPRPRATALPGVRWQGCPGEVPVEF